MSRSKSFLRYLLYPHAAVMIPLVLLSFSLLIYSFLFWGSEHVGSYVAYVLSAYALTLICLRVPAILHAVKHENKYVLRWKGDPHLRITLSLYGTLIFNTVYAVFQLGLGVYHTSVWFYALAAYYLLLALARFFLLRHTKGYTPGKNIKAELSRYRLCGILLLVMHLVLGIIVFFITWQNRTFVHHEITTIAMAAYTFTTFTVAIVGLVRYRKYNSPVFSAVKCIALASALVSMLTLETAMLTAFSGNAEENFRRLMTGITGSTVVLFVLGMALFMILHATKELEKLKINKTQI